MGLLSNRIDPSSLERGDHIYCYRNKHIYSHHGIYIGDNRVIHFTRTRSEENDTHSTGWSFSSSSSPKSKNCKECGYNPKKHRGVVKSCLECFLEGHGLFRFEYGVSSSRFVANRSGTCSTGQCRYSPDETVKRATERLDRSSNDDDVFGEYKLFSNNCETFAVYCKTGKRVSLQAFSLRNKAETAFRDLTDRPLSDRNLGKAFFKLAFTHKVDNLRHDIAVHQKHDDHDDTCTHGGT